MQNEPTDGWARTFGPEEAISYDSIIEFIRNPFEHKTFHSLQNIQPNTLVFVCVNYPHCAFFDEYYELKSPGKLRHLHTPTQLEEI